MIYNKTVIDDACNTTGHILFRGPDNKGGELDITLTPHAMEILIREFSQDFNLSREMVVQVIHNAAESLADSDGVRSVMAFLEYVAVDCSCYSMDINKVDA